MFKTDFGVIGMILCGDIYSPEICRALALQGAEIIFCPSQSWGASGQFNLWMQQARAIDNAVYMAAAHFPMSDVSQRSYVIDPYGYPLAASHYWRDSVVLGRRRPGRRPHLVRPVRHAGHGRPQGLPGRLLSQDDSREAHRLPLRAVRRTTAGTVSADCGEDLGGPRSSGGNPEENDGTALSRDALASVFGEDA